jgi:phage FluMu gp28-like protein
MSDEKNNHDPGILDGMFLPYQQRWLDDDSRLKIIEKSRQIGMTYTDACDSVFKASHAAGHDVWVSTRDEKAAVLYLEFCKRWARGLNLLAQDLGAQIIDRAKDLKVYSLKFTSGFCIHAMSSCPDALAGRTGHIKLDEYALHQDARELFRVAKGCTQWGGQIAIISTHRGADTAFNEFLRGIREQGNPMGFSYHRVSIFDAVEQGLCERINTMTGADETRSQFLTRMRAECIDDEHWQREYCCQPCDESKAFITHEMITANESPNCLKPFEYLETCPNSLYCGIDVARKKHLCVIDVGEKIGDVLWDRYRLELLDKTFSEIEHELHRILRLPKLQRCCIDATGLGMQLAEQARQRFGWKAEPVTFTAPVKEELAFELRRAFEDRSLRIDPSPALRNDLRGIKKEVTPSNNIRFVGESEDSHCDRFWAKALRQYAARRISGVGAALAL